VGLVGALVGRVERGGAERFEDVVGPPGEFAGDGQARAGVRETARLERVVVVVVGTGLMGRALRGFEERPAQWRGALAGELAQLGVSVGAVHADVDAGHPDRLPGGVQSRDVAELAQRDQRGDLAHPVLGHQRLAAGLAARKRTEVSLDRGDLDLEQIDHL